MQGRIEGLVNAGHATRKEADALHEQRFIGNEVVHRLYTPTNAEVLAALNIVEHIVFQIYEIENAARTLGRKRRAKEALARSSAKRGDAPDAAAARSGTRTGLPSQLPAPPGARRPGFKT